MSARLEELLQLARLGSGSAVAKIEGSDPILPTAFDVGHASAAALAAVGIAASEMHRLRGGAPQTVTVETRAAAASLLSFAFQRLEGVETPRPAGAFATVAMYPARDDRFIHLHGGFPGLREGTLRVLGCEDTAESVARAVAERDAWELEDELAEARMCGAVARTAEEWAAHPQGAWLAQQPVVEIERIGDASPETPQLGERPLERMRVLDLTRVLAGPTCARTLAAQGAEVLKIAGPQLPFVEPFVLDTGHGKRSAYLDLGSAAGRERLTSLVREADVFSQGFRSGTLERRGFGEANLAQLRPGIVAVSINCYGHGGPWHARPGWEQLAQTATGIAVEHGGFESPSLIPAAATDYTTGYLAAFGVLVALTRRAQEGGSWAVRASLSQTATWLQRGQRVDRNAASGVDPSAIERHFVDSHTPLGTLRHLGPILEMSQTPPRWEQPTVPLGTHPPEWRD